MSINITEAFNVWAALGDIPVDNNMNIELDFLHFPAGTDAMEIWHWIEDTYDVSIAEDLMQVAA